MRLKLFLVMEIITLKIVFLKTKNPLKNLPDRANYVCLTESL